MIIDTAFDPTQPLDFDSAIKKLKDKDLLPLSLSSDEIQRRMDADLRDRSFFSARVANAEILQGFKDAVNKVVNGTSNEASQRLEMKLLLKKYEYRPAPGKEGTIEDLSSNKRLNLILNTNVSMVQGFGQWQEGNNPAVLIAAPAQELTRHGRRKVPRQWRTIWDEAKARLGDSTTALWSSTGHLAALKNDPIWSAISDFGLPWPPFKFNSGMGVDDIFYEEAVELGLAHDLPLETPTAVAKKLTAAVPQLGMNTGLSTSVEGISPDLLNVLGAALSGFSLIGTELIADRSEDVEITNRSVGEVIWFMNGEPPLLKEVSEAMEALLE